MTAGSFDENRVVQIGIVVKNIDDAVQAWSQLLGVDSPPIVLTDALDIAHTQYHGQTTSARARLAFFNLGQVALELIQPVGEPSTWNDQLSAFGPSIHHLAFEIKGMDGKIAGLAKHGLQLVQRGDYVGGRYAYVEGQSQLGAVIELLEND